MPDEFERYQRELDEAEKRKMNKESERLVPHQSALGNDIDEIVGKIEAHVEQERALEERFMAQNPEELTNERAKTHGSFADHARCTRRLKDVINDEHIHRVTRGQSVLSSQQAEAIDMILHKIGRVMAGDASFQDHWDDIAGYAHIANKDFSNDS